MKKVWKQAVTRGLATVTAMVMLAGCSGGSETETSASADGAGGKEVNISFSWWGNDDRHKVTQDAIKKFEAANEGVQVEAQPSGFGSVDEQFATRYAGGTQADMMTLQYYWIDQYSPNGEGFYDLGQVEDIVDLTQYDEEFLKFGQSGESQQAVPLGKNVLCFMANKTAYERVGLEVPTTWEEYKEAAKKFPEGTFLLVSPTFRFAATYYLQQVTGKTEFSDTGEMNYTQADYEAAMTWYKDLADAGVWCTRKDYLENVGSEPMSIAQNAKYIDGGYVGVFEWNGGIVSNATTLEDKGDELVIAPLPIVEGAKFEGSLAKPTMMFGISKDSKNPKEAAQLLQYLVNDPEGVKAMGTSRGVPESKAAVAALKEDGQIEGVIAQGYEFGTTAPVLNETPFYENGTFNNIYMQQYEQFEAGQVTAEEAAKQVYEQIKTQVEELVK